MVVKEYLVVFNLLLLKVKPRDHSLLVKPVYRYNCSSSNSQFIEENSSNQSKLFRESKRLFNIQADKTLPPHTNAVKLANDMGDYFFHKITAIRSKLAASTKSLPSAAQESTTTLEPVSNFRLNRFLCRGGRYW